MISGGAQIITFYSYKGGTGRSMHLANVAWILASNGKNVLVVDWDLEAPGLHRYFRPFLIDKELTATDGLIDLMWDFADAAMTPVPEAERAPGWHEDYADLVRCTAAVRWPFPGRLDLLPAGRQCASYSRRVNSFNWQNFYDRLGGGVFLETIKERMRQDYDYVLIDSRTGVSDTAGVCTVQMPDALVLCFTANNQSIEGCASIAHSVRSQWAADPRRTPDRQRILPLLTRVDGSEKDKLNTRRALARARFDPFVTSSTAIGSADEYWRDIEVPYVPWYSYEEVIAAFADKYKEKISVLDSAEALVRVLTRGEITSAVRPGEDDRVRVLAQFAVGGDAPPGTQTAASQALASASSSPYPGLQPFFGDEATMFFGRAAELDQLIGLLRAGEREIYVIGPSGSGKSSLVSAGLIPLLARAPERVKARFLVRSVAHGAEARAQLAAALAVDPDIAASELGAAVAGLLARQPGCDRLLLVIDHLEELLILPDAAERARAIGLIRALRHEPRTVLLLLLRSDHLRTFIDSPLGADLEGRFARVDVAAMTRDALREVIAGPARLMDVRVEPALVERLVADFGNQPGGLPLLQVTLAELWHRRQGGVLTVAHYDELGRAAVAGEYKPPGDGARSGLGFTVSKYADTVLRRLTRAQEVMALRILIRLVSFGEGRADTRRQQPRETLRSIDDTAAEFDAVLQRLVDSRLVTVSGDNEGGDARVDLAHEALIRAWSTFAEWIKAQRAPEQRRRALEAAAVSWRARGSGEGSLLDPEDLADAVAWRDRHAQQLGHSADLDTLLFASETARVQANRRRRRRTRVAFAVIVGFAVLTSALALVARSNADEANQARRDAIERRNQRDGLIAESSQFYQETGRQRLVEAERPLEALPYLVAAREAAEASGGQPDESLGMLFAEATRHLPLTPQLAHDDNVVSAAFSPDGTRVVTASWDDTARVWDVATGRLVGRPLAHHNAVSSAAFSRDGTRIVTSSSDNTAQVWETATGKAITEPLEHHASVISTVFSPDGSRVATASWDATARIWNAATGKPVSPPLPHHNVVNSVAFSPDGTRVVTASLDQTAQVWDAATGRPVSPPLRHGGAVIGAVFSPDGTRVATASWDYTARVWDAATGRPVSPPLDHHDLVTSVAFNPAGTRVVTASVDHTARVWDAATGKPVSPLLEHRDRVNSAAFSPDGTRVVTASQDHTARVWSAVTGKPLLFPFEHQDAVNSAAFSRDGAKVVTASFDRTARVWDAFTGRPVLSPFPYQRPRTGGMLSVLGLDGARVIIAGADHKAQIWNAAFDQLVSPLLELSGGAISASFSADGARVATGSDDGTARVWDADTGAPVSPPIKHRGAVVSVEFSRDGTRLVTASRDGTARVWNAGTGAPVALPLTHAGPVVSAAFSADGTRVVTASDDRSARVWDAARGNALSSPLEHLGGVVSAAFSADGARVITASDDQTARVWDAITGDPLSPPLAHQKRVVSAAFSADGRRVVTASDDKTARVWDAVSGKPLSPPLAHQAGVMSAGFTSDGARVITTDNDWIVRVWDAVTGKPLSPPLAYQDNLVSAASGMARARIIATSGDDPARPRDLPRATGTLAEWRAIAERVSTYVLSNGVLSPIAR